MNKELNVKLEKPSYGQTIKINGNNIFFNEEGEGPVILYIHGNLGSHLWFSDVMKIEGFRTIAVDMPNFGFSDSIDNCEIETYSGFMRDFLDEMHIDKIVLVGHSLGGAVALTMAVQYPEIIRSLFLLDSSSIKGLKTPEESYRVIEMYKTDYSLLKNALRAIMPGVSDENRILELVATAKLMKHEAYIGHARALDKFDLSSMAVKMDFPVLFVRGEMDFLITREMAEETIALVGGNIINVDNIGHSLLVEDPSLFKEILVGFIM